MNPQTLAIIQARMGSTRLPGKVLEPIGKLPALGHVIERLKYASRLDGIVVACPASPENADIFALATKHDVDGYMYPGPENDVLARFYAAATCYRAHIVVRITADCPFIDPTVVDRVVGALGFPPEGHPAYASNIIVRTMPDGLDCEAFTFRALADAFRATRKEHEPGDLEHVTPWMLRNITDQTSVEDPIDRSNIRWTLDTPQDYEWFRWIAVIGDTTPPHPTTRELYDMGRVAHGNS